MVNAHVDVCERSADRSWVPSGYSDGMQLVLQITCAITARGDVQVQLLSGCEGEIMTIK